MIKIVPPLATRVALLAVLALALPFAGCERSATALWLASYDADVRAAEKVLTEAHDDAGRAAGLSARARARSEKARYSRFRKLIPPAEYERLFALAVADFDRAAALDPSSAKIYEARGRTYYDRGALEEPGSSEFGRWLGLAEADFTSALERDARSASAYDMRALIHSSRGEDDAAIADFSSAATLEPSFRPQWAEAHCRRGVVRQKAGEADLAIADYEQSMAIGVPPGSCDCDPYTPLAWVYLDAKKDYDRSWAIVARARAERHWVAPELIERLKRESGRDAGAR